MENEILFMFILSFFALIAISFVIYVLSADIRLLRTKNVDLTRETSKHKLIINEMQDSIAKLKVENDKRALSITYNQLAFASQYNSELLHKLTDIMTNAYTASIKLINESTADGTADNFITCCLEQQKVFQTAEKALLAEFSNVFNKNIENSLQKLKAEVGYSDSENTEAVNPTAAQAESKLDALMDQMLPNKNKTKKYLN